MLLRDKITLLFFLFQFTAVAQTVSDNSQKIEGLKLSLRTATSDSAVIQIMGRLGFNYQVINIDSALKYTQLGIDLATQRGDVRQEASLLATMSGIMSQQGKFADALDLLFKSLQIATVNNLTYEIARANRRLGGVYLDLENFPKALLYNLKALDIDERNKFTSAATDHIFLANVYEKMDRLDSAAFHVNEAFKGRIAIQEIIQAAYRIAGDIKVGLNDYESAGPIFREGLAYAQKNVDFLTGSEICSSLATMFYKLGKRDSAIYYALKGFEYGQHVTSKKGVIVSAELLAELYSEGQPVVALKYYKIAAAGKDSLFGVANIQTIQNLITREEEKQKELAAARLSYNNRLKLYALLAGVGVLLIIAGIMYRNIKQKQKANGLLQRQKEKVELTLGELKVAQAQLIQSEKMASLGELTAGIAHEIQNPLNFVNNFSELSTELIDEMKEELNKENYQGVGTIAEDIKQNLKKINHHGKRADAIVKGMLQHSRSSSSGKKEPADLNQLAEEYLRLAYHGFRAKEKGCNATLNTSFDESIGSIDIVPQDIGRVLLNIITNALYAVNEKSKSGMNGYTPVVTVTTKKMNNNAEIKIIDNGFGIPPKIIDKIFQPFFTTKPTGQGTGLGLSLAYDIVKAHGGDLKVTTNEGRGTEFTVTLPAAKQYS